MTAPYQLRFGALDMSPAAQVGDVEFRVYGLRRGRPVPVKTAAESMIFGFSGLERTTSYTPREQSLVVGLKGPDTAALDLAEESLALECGKQRNELAWTAADGYGGTTVFDVLDYAELEFSDADDWDLLELKQCERVYTITLSVFPWGRGEDEVVHNALTAGGTPTTLTIADGTDATGWTSPYDTVTVSSGSLLAAASSTASTSTVLSDRIVSFWPWEFDKSLSAVDFTATQYLSFDVEATLSVQYPPTAPQVFVDGVELTLLATRWVTATKVNFTYLCNDASASALRIKGTAKTWTTDLFSPPPRPSIKIDNVQRSNQPPVASSTGRQAVRSITQGGSARSEGRFMVSHDTVALGDVIVFSCPALANGSTPDLRRWKSSGGSVTTDTGTVSGSRETLGGTAFTIPAAQLARGGYLLYARVRSTSGTPSPTLTGTASTKIGATTFESQSSTSEPTTLDTSTWKIVPVGSFVLPTTDLPDGSSASVQISVSASTGSVEWDEMWLFYAGDDSALTIAALGSGGSPTLGTRHNRLWLDAASLDRPTPAIWAGTLADRSDAFHAGSLVAAIGGSWKVPSLVPGDNLFFVVTTGATFAGLEVRAYERVHTHKGP